MQPRIVEDEAAAASEFLSQPNSVLIEPSLMSVECNHADQLITRDHRQKKRCCRWVSVEDIHHRIGLPVNPLGRRGQVQEEDGLPGTDHLRDWMCSGGVYGMVGAAFSQSVFLLDVDVRDSDSVKAPAVIDVHDASVGDTRHGETRDILDRFFRTE